MSWIFDIFVEVVSATAVITLESAHLVLQCAHSVMSTRAWMYYYESIQDAERPYFLKFHRITSCDFNYYLLITYRLFYNHIICVCHQYTILPNTSAVQGLRERAYFCLRGQKTHIIKLPFLWRAKKNVSRMSQPSVKELSRNWCWRCLIQDFRTEMAFSFDRRYLRNTSQAHFKHLLVVFLCLPDKRLVIIWLAIIESWMVHAYLQFFSQNKILKTNSSPNCM